MEFQDSSFRTPKSHKPFAPASPMDHRPDLSSKIRVIARMRPFLPREISSKDSNTLTSCVSLHDQDFECQDEVTVHLKDPSTSRCESYKLDSFFGQEDNNISLIFEREVRPLIPGVFSGHNATVFAYGATGSGKTYTMQGTEELPGLMPLAMSTVLSICQRKGSTAEISYYEVYIEKCCDLLQLDAKEVMILDDKDGHIHFKGLSRVSVNSMSEFQEVFSLGIQRRKTAHTGLNDVSSRSHGVLVIGVSTPLGDGSGSVVSGKLNLIDLAGNEDNGRTCNEGIRLIESAKINQSLFALSKVIFALNNNEPRVPYRESKLTRILQDSLGGTSRALMVACLNPGEYQESVRTVSLAAKSRHISNFVSSAQKPGTTKIEVNMAEKLRIWLESKGKTKSIQRIGTFGSPPFGSTVKKPDYHNSAKAKVNTFRGASNAKKRTMPKALGNASNDADLTCSLSEFNEQSPNCVGKDNGEEISAHSEIVVDSTTHLPIEPLNKQEKMSFVDSKDSAGASPVSEKKSNLQSPLRKVLSPINSNVNRITNEKLAPAGLKSEVLFEPKTPSTVTRRIENFGTPLDKFNAMSSNLKSSLMQEYIDILNTASREELRQIKGIGVKIAEYIVELRETSPLKSLNDIEKIGLSSKQVYNMFSKAAQGMFDKEKGHEGATSTGSETLKIK